MSSMVERVAKALCRHHFDMCGNDDEREDEVVERRWPMFTPQARAAIEAIEKSLRRMLKGEFSSLTIGYNDASASNYCSVAKFYEEYGEMAEHGDWISDEERDAAMANNSEWSLQWYPDTPVGFYCVKASSLASVLDAALEDK